MESRTALWSFFRSSENNVVEADGDKNTEWESSVGMLAGLSQGALPYVQELTVRDFLGEGTSFAVYNCESVGRVGRSLAIKMPQNRGHQNQKGVATTTLREIQIMAYEPLRESTPIVDIQAYIWFPFDRVPSLVVENAFYGTLDNFISVFISHQADGWTLRHRLCQDIARGLEALHSEGIVHGDVKPQNILVKNSSSIKNDPESVITARLTDFGHSSFCSENNGYESYVGTPLFSSPEVLVTLYGDSASETLKRGDWPKCDVWSFGLTACCIISTRANYFQDEWLSAEFSDPPRREHFLLSQSPSYLTEKACELIENGMAEETSPMISEKLRTVFLELVKGCLESDRHKRYSMCTASKLLDVRKYIGPSSLK